MRKLSIITLALLLSTTTQLVAQVRSELLLEKNWKFTRDDNPASTQPGYDDSQWQRVTIPHDWAIYGPFDVKNDPQDVAIAQDGQTEAMSHAGRTGGLPFVGVGWYRTEFEAPSFTEGKRASIKFDGAMSNAQVYINGEKVGYWPYGYNTFHFDITEFMKAGETNSVAVRLENYPQSSRWYPGAGLYRNVHVIITDGAHIPVWGTQITTPKVTKEYATIEVQTTLSLDEGEEMDNYSLETSIVDPEGQEVANIKSPINSMQHNDGRVKHETIVHNPALWNVETPELYTAISRLYNGKELVDEYNTVFGVRSIEVVPQKGFFINGEKVIFQGVCMHHDLGPLGGAVNEAAIRRMISILKDMGCNAIRTSHNMPAPELIKACDEMGMLVMAESFDEWDVAKCANGYHKYFNDWAEKDMVNLIHNYRNNPSVVMWCIGNEVPNQWYESGAKVARFLQDICHREDPTRPVTNGMDAPDAVVNNNFAAIMDVAGFNYRPFRYRENYNKLPQQLILGSETASTVSSRGVYKFPVVRQSMKMYDDHQSSSYDVEHCGWSNLPEDDFIQHEDLPFAMGEFVWTGFDYLGEPTPYYTNWPSHSSLFGIVDLAGIPKDRYYLYRSHWNKSEETLHILPHWNWEGREGEVTPIFVYTNHPSAELFINGKSQGIRTKDLSIHRDSTQNSESEATFERQKRYRLMWMETTYKPGTVKVVAYDKDGNAVAEQEMHTAGKPHHIELTADRQSITADGRDISFINVRVVDKDGNLCPEASNNITFTVKGEGFYRAGANGNSVNLQPFHLPEMELFSGQMTALIQSTDQPGSITVEASTPGIKKGKIVITTK